MEFSIAPRYKAAILRQYRKHLSRYPTVWEEVESFLQGKDETFCLCMQYLYGHMAAQDVLSFSPEMFAGFVRATLQAFARIDYLKTVPPEIFFPYVLYHRVNSECLDDSRPFLLQTLAPYVQGKTMEQTALCVNYWCYAHATYTPADQRTLGPLGVLRRTLGRCGEESVLAVAALRSVGIPARQCYCPRWSHCDDNHAWVEVWIDGSWHYLGACEPEAVLDRGWFTAAASRAMLVDTKCWADWDTDALYQTVNCTSGYTGIRSLQVQVTDRGVPVAGASVKFQIVNYSELYTLWETATDARGFAFFETGPGDLFVFARHGQKVALEKVDLRRQTSVKLELAERFPGYVSADLAAPEDSSGAVPYEDPAPHLERLRQCQAHLAARRSVFAESAGFLRHAAGNAPQIQSFLADDTYPQSHKDALLSTLRPKDFVDISRQTLEDALLASADARGRYAPEIFRDYILSPRVADEMLLPQRQRIRDFFPQGFADPTQILLWMHRHMQILPEEGIGNYYPSAYGCLRCRQVPAFAFDMVFVSLCRAFCFPARLESATAEAQWLDSNGIWQSIHPQAEPISLTLELPPEAKLNYFEHITLGRWDGSDFITLQYPDLTLQTRHTFHLQPGLYRLSLTTRQIDGTASVALWHWNLQSSRSLPITPPEDQTPQRLKQIPLTLPQGPVQTLLERSAGSPRILIFAQPGSEPTEHLLQEMLECAADFRKLPCRIFLFVNTPEALAHPTVALLKAALGEAEFHCLQDTDALAALHLQLRAGDLRPPFVVCLDADGRGVYADANYRIRMAQTLVNVQTILARQP